YGSSRVAAGTASEVPISATAGPPSSTRPTSSRRTRGRFLFIGSISLEQTRIQDKDRPAARTALPLPESSLEKARNRWPGFTLRKTVMLDSIWSMPMSRLARHGLPDAEAPPGGAELLAHQLRALAGEPGQDLVRAVAVHIRQLDMISATAL